MAEGNQETPKSPFVRYINTSKTQDPQNGIGTNPNFAGEVANIQLNRSSQGPEPRQLKPEEDLHLYPKSGEPGTSSVKGGPASRRTTTLETERQRERASGTEREERERERASGRETEERERELARRRQREQREKDGARRREREDRWPPPRVLAAMAKQMSELSEDIRKVKAVLVKQEKRIRAIEAAVEARLAAAAPSPVPPDM